MTAPETLDELHQLLSQVPGEDAVVFTYGGAPIGAGFHVTELRLDRSTGIDCGGTISRWDVARVQLLDGPGPDGARMRSGKLVAILAQSLVRVPGLGSAPFAVEFAPANAGLQTLTVGQVEIAPGAVTLPLLDTRAVCRPATRAAPGASCCAPAAAACC